MQSAFRQTENLKLVRPGSFHKIPQEYTYLPSSKNRDLSFHKMPHENTKFFFYKPSQNLNFSFYKIPHQTISFSFHKIFLLPFASTSKIRAPYFASISKIINKNLWARNFYLRIGTSLSTKFLFSQYKRRKIAWNKAVCFNKIAAIVYKNLGSGTALTKCYRWHG